MSIIITVRERSSGMRTNAPRRGQMQIKGRVFDCGDGTVVELFKASALALAIDRDVQNIRKWIVQGLLPPPVFKIEGEWSENRKPPSPGFTMYWFTGPQIQNANRIFLHKYGGKKYGRGGITQQMLADIKAIWYVNKVAISEKTGEIET